VASNASLFFFFFSFFFQFRPRERDQQRGQHLSAKTYLRQGNRIGGVSRVRFFHYRKFLSLWTSRVQDYHSAQAFAFTHVRLLAITFSMLKSPVIHHDQICTWTLGPLNPAFLSESISTPSGPRPLHSSRRNALHARTMANVEALSAAR